MKSLLCVLMSLIAVANGSAQTFSPADFVDPFIGTAGHGHTFPGATTPFGMVQLSPDTRIDGSWDGCSGYHDSDSLIYGFSHTHLSGTGCSDLGDIAILPMLDLQNQKPGRNGKDLKEAGLTYSHLSETAEAGYYAVTLGNGVRAELTATPRTGMHRYTFPERRAYLVLKLDHRDQTLSAEAEQASATRITGSRQSKAWATDQQIYFAMDFSVPFSEMLVTEYATPEIGPYLEYAVLEFDLGPDKTLLVRTGISQVDTLGAARNLKAELNHWDFDKVKAEAKALWNKSLSQIEVSDHGNQPDKLKIFYTALYHCMIHPSLASDVDHRYRGRDQLVHEARDFEYYNIFSLWDTYRALHPLLVLIEPERTRDFIRTFIAQYEQSGRLPVWELSGNETNCMIGYHAVSVMADAFVKGIRGFDADKALEAMLVTANRGVNDLADYRQYGFIPADHFSESVSKTLEYAYDDWCIMQFANAAYEDLRLTPLLERVCVGARSWENVFDPESKFMRARAHGKWYSPFEPTEVNFNYTEANAWQYRFYAPQHMAQLISRHGGPEAFEKALDQMFTADSRTTGREQADISGMIGQYAHGNEPSHHLAYLYAFVDHPEKGQAIIRRIVDDLYTSKRDGLCGNEDCGQMSAWYVFSAMGFYPVTPGSAQYVAGIPAFPEIKLRTGGREIRILAENFSQQNRFARSISWNGNPTSCSFIDHRKLADGGTLSFDMVSQPEFVPASASSAELPKESDENTCEADFLLTPFILASSPTFTDSLQIEIIAPGCDEILYTFNGNEPGRNGRLYSGPFYVDRSVMVAAVGTSGKKESPVALAHFKRIPGGRTIQLLTRYDNQYTGGGDNALIDQLRGGFDFRLGAWQGYWGVDVEAVIDLGSVQKVYSVKADFLQDQGSWILLPMQVTFEGSIDGTHFFPLRESTPNTPKDREGALIETMGGFIESEEIRWVRMKALNAGLMPDWHPGAGGKSWIFIDEIVIN